MSVARTMTVASLHIIITCFLFVTTTTTALSPQGFTIDLIRRPANSSSSRLSPTQLGDGSSPYTDTTFDTSLYVMKLQIGTPPVEFEAALDTGSDLLWIQCLPCLNCFDQLDPYFDPSKSSTFKAKQCNDNPDHTCPYNIIYADQQTYSKGIFATETVTLQSTSGQPFPMPDIIFGCGNNNTRVSPSSSGIVGLNWGQLSLISQMGDDFMGLLSYCFSGKGTSKLNFGSNAIVSGDGTVSTTMFKKQEHPNFYYLNLDAISVGDARVETLGTSFHGTDGNIFIDSGTTYTYLPESYCNLVKGAIENVVPEEDKVEIYGDMLCYKTGTIDIFPVMTMHFGDGADLVLDKYNMYMDAGGGSFCVTLMCSPPSPGAPDAIFGNRAQNNFLIGYDTSSQLISFKPTDCASLWS